MGKEYGYLLEIKAGLMSWPGVEKTHGLMEYPKPVILKTNNILKKDFRVTPLSKRQWNDYYKLTVSGMLKSNV